MKVCKKFLLPLLAGFLAGALTTSLSLFLFVNRFFLAPEGMKELFENDGLSLTGMMILSAYLLYAVMLVCRKLNGRLLNDTQEEISGRYFVLYFAGTALAAAAAMLAAMANEGHFAATLVLICYMLVSNLIVIIAFAVVILLIKWLLKLMGKNGAFLYRLKWQFPLSLLWIIAAFVVFIYFG